MPFPKTLVTFRVGLKKELMSEAVIRHFPEARISFLMIKELPMEPFAGIENAYFLWTELASSG